VTTWTERSVSVLDPTSTIQMTTLTDMVSCESGFFSTRRWAEAETLEVSVLNTHCAPSEYVVRTSPCNEVNSPHTSPGIDSATSTVIPQSQGIACCPHSHSSRSLKECLSGRINHNVLPISRKVSDALMRVWTPRFFAFPEHRIPRVPGESMFLSRLLRPPKAFHHIPHAAHHKGLSIQPRKLATQVSYARAN